MSSPLQVLVPPPLLPLVSWMVVATPLVAPLLPLILLMLRLPCPLMPPLQFASCLPAGCRVDPVVVPLPPFVLLTRRRLLSTSPPGCLLFSGWLSCRISLRRLHLASPFVVPPPHVSIIDPLPSSAPAGCCIASCCATSASCPLVNTAASWRTAASRHAGNSTSRLPLVRHDWLPRRLLWHLCLTSVSLPSPLPPPLVTSRSCPPRLVIVLSPVYLWLCNRHPPSPLLPMVGCCIFCPHSIISHCCCVASPHVVPLPPIPPLLGLLYGWLLHHLPFVWLVVASPLLTPPPPICGHLRLSDGVFRPLKCTPFQNHGM